MQRRNRKFQFTAETLEARRVMDGNVGILIVGNTLQITGDDLSNSISLQSEGTGLRVVGTSTPEGNTNILFNGNFGTSHLITGLDFSKLDMKINLNGGDDRVTIGSRLSTTQAKSLTIDTGAGADSAQLINLAITGKTSVKTFQSAGENEQDVVRFLAGGTYGGDLSVRTGGGNDFVLSAQIKVDKKLTIDSGDGDDGITWNLGVARNLSIRGGKGIDRIAVLNSQVNKVSLDGGEGNDDFHVQILEATDLRVAGGKGNDFVKSGNLTISRFGQFDGGVGSDTIHLGAAFSNLPLGSKPTKNFEVQDIT